ncbi:prepilin-type N-terminal cleavage/methylation domain-containing protein [Bdellovibrionota bacterium FG-2]
MNRSLSRLRLSPSGGDLTQEGFTLVELMIVVAIIGILSAVAIPNYQKFQSKARQTEAKISLSAAYTAERSYYSEQSTYTSCLNIAGFSPAAGKKYYAVGFLATFDGTNCGPSGGKTCFGNGNWGGTISTCADGNGVNYFNATDKMGSAAATGADLQTGASPNRYGSTSSTQFWVWATGSISSGTIRDQWSIDSTKALINEISGL